MDTKLKNLNFTDRLRKIAKGVIKRGKIIRENLSMI